MAIPVMVQHVTVSNSLGGTVSPGAKFRVRLPEPTQAGNCLVLGFQALFDSTISVSDDQGNTWTTGPKRLRAADNQSIFLFIAANIAAGTRVIFVTNTYGSDISFLSAVATEFQNVAPTSPLDGAGSGNDGSSTLVQAGAITPSQTDDLLYQFAVRTSSPNYATSFTAGSQSNITWKLLSADLQDGSVAQWGQYASTSSITPELTQNPTTGWASVAIALKTTTQGAGRPSGIRVAAIHHISQPGTLTAMPGAHGISNPSVIQVPSIGNLLVAAVSSGSVNLSITAITDSLGNTWQELGSGATFNDPDPNNRDNCHLWYAENAITGPTLAVTVSWVDPGILNDATILFYDIVGADPVQHVVETTAGATGDQTVAAATITTTTITPAKAQGLVIMLVQQEFNTEDGITLSGALFDSIEYDGMSVDGPQNMDQNGGWAHYYNPDTSNITATWTLIADTGDPMREWAAYAGFFSSLETLYAFVGEPRCGHGILSA